MRIKPVLLVLAVAVYGLMAIPTLSFAESLDQKAQDASRLLFSVTGGQYANIPPDVIQNAFAVAVFPGIGKAAFLAGASYGTGLVSVRNSATDWSPPAFVNFYRGSAGLQAGIQSEQLILVFMTKNSVEKLLSGSFKMGGDLTFTLGSAIDWSKGYVTPAADILVYGHQKGLFVGVSLNGSRIGLSKGKTAKFYNAPGIDPVAVLTSNAVSNIPAPGRSFRDVLAYETHMASRPPVAYYGTEHNHR